MEKYFLLYPSTKRSCEPSTKVRFYVYNSGFPSAKDTNDAKWTSRWLLVYAICRSILARIFYTSLAEAIAKNLKLVFVV
jgi:hypothetical protein